MPNHNQPDKARIEVRASELLALLRTLPEPEALSLLVAALERAARVAIPAGFRACGHCHSVTHEDYWKDTHVQRVESCPVCHRRQRV